MVNERVENLPTDVRVRWCVAAGVAAGFLLFVAALASAQDADRSRLREPVFRVEKDDAETSPSDAEPETNAAPRNNTQREQGNSNRVARETSDNPPANRLAAKSDAVGDEVEQGHPLDAAIAMARKALANIESNVDDYHCTLVKRERVNGVLMDHEFMTCKVRHARKQGGEDVPFSVYLRFRKPDSVAGREVVYIRGENDGKLTAHEGGLKGRFIPTVSLLPNSALAMRGNRYPITEIGIETLTRRLIEKGVRDRKIGKCQVRMIDGAKVAGRVCTMLEVFHAEHNPQYDFHMARVFLDTELNIPIRYEAYGFPSSSGGKPPLLEEYTYMNLKLNVGMKNSDFDTKNPKYNF